MIDFKIVRSRRKTAQIYILEDGTVEVRCPVWMKEQDILSGVADKQDWIRKQTAKKQEEYANKQSFALSVGSALLYLGREYPIYEKDTKQVGFDENGFFVPRGLSPIQPYIIALYKKLAKAVISQKIEMFAKRMGVTPKSVKINSAKKRWGSCSGKDSLNFSWRLILADEKAVDYVVVHELAHIKEHNHSARFWQAVEGVLPDYRQREKMLKALQDKLAQEDWD